ncbi:SMC-Scp complex subunit ScpB [Acetobacter oeni]|uniref:Segregation and condensation protein B n=1 Tax=Acetobacter oeni TaxID=304077 RepID=A0A511XLP8_9PROT|nr:SMC-Scp complex subunit ScpB [Acetobacter oeni]MBB3884308.1 segregation and condensation protein B [Acetobacter oeni]NHO20245.1 SMC-Scp complex subunit ScpB [Acetobacter oeni]GBR07645.1 chromosome segregation and condensation protein ScpB [Acetobacter oeni LMG 21952]GEN63862.1 hypothetical protein AOE01nite_20860 [Acetobacter oeni]
MSETEALPEAPETEIIDIAPPETSPDFTPEDDLAEEIITITEPLSEDIPAPEPDPPSEQAVRLVEALIFASTEPVSPRTILSVLEGRELIPDSVDDLGACVRAVLTALVARYEGRGVGPVEVAGGWQFRTAPDLAPLLTRVLPKPRRLQRATMETLAIIAYHQPCTRAEIEEIRGVSVGQNALDTLIGESLIAPRGRKEVPGRPVLWGTTPDFLRFFGLQSLNDLPRREELLGDMPTSPKIAPASGTSDLLLRKTPPDEETPDSDTDPDMPSDEEPSPDEITGQPDAGA